MVKDSGEVGRGTSIDRSVSVQLRIVARVALAIALVSVVELVILLFLLNDSSGANYWQKIRSHSVTYSYLRPAMGIAGLSIFAFAGGITWVVALLYSFRVAGPLFRFARNLEGDLAEDGNLHPIRASDEFQAECRQLRSTLLGLREHRGKLADLANVVLDSESNPDAAAEALHKLIEVQRNVRL